MTARDADLDARVSALLADPQYEGHPLREALQALHDRMASQLARIEKVTALSDGFQMMARHRELSMADQFDRQLRRLSKIVAISDRYQEVLRDQNQAVIDASYHDALTELLNRRGLSERLRDRCDAAVREDRGFCVAMVDVDHFKQVNDTYGHQAGDRALIALGRVMTTELTDPDFCGRWGGEEFVIFIGDPDLQTARRVLERLLASIRDMRVPAGDDSLSLTVSVGVAQHKPGEALALTLNRADIALYDAKESGRNSLGLERAQS